MIVVDASALTDFLLGRLAVVDTVQEALAEDPQQALHAPELVDLEVLNAVRRLARGGALEAARADAVVVDLGDARVIRHPHAPLRPRVWELRDGLTAYDAAYLALAEALGARLVTCDGGLGSAAKGSLGAERVSLVP